MNYETALEDFWCWLKKIHLIPWSFQWQVRRRESLQACVYWVFRLKVGVRWFPLATLWDQIDNTIRNCTLGAARLREGAALYPRVPRSPLYRLILTIFPSLFSLESACDARRTQPDREGNTARSFSRKQATLRRRTKSVFLFLLCCLKQNSNIMD